MMFRSVSIAPRAMLSFGVIAVLVFVFGGFALAQMARMHGRSAEVDGNWVPSLNSLSDVVRNVLLVRSSTLRLLLSESDSQFQETLERVQALRSELADTQQHYQTLISSPAEQAAYEHFQRVEQVYMAGQTQLVAALRGADRTHARQLLQEVLNPNADEMVTVLNQLIAINRQGAALAAQVSNRVYDQALLGTLLVMGLAAAATLILATLFTRSIVRPLATVVAVAGSVAEGNLTQEIDTRGRDEPAQLLRALKDMQQRLRGTIGQMSRVSEQLAVAAGQLGSAAEDSVHDLQQQGAEIEQAATAVTQMSSTVDEVALNAASASSSSIESGQSARQSSASINQTLTSITRLAADVDSTCGGFSQLAQAIHGIGQVLDVIREVAEQTNQLALSAAIEAHRAGEAGRGFAAVADDVRLLAYKTGQSTLEIETMISAIQGGMMLAVRSMDNCNGLARHTLYLAQDAGHALQGIIDSIGQINHRNLVIASATQEQAHVAREVDRNLINIRDLSQKNTRGSEQTRSASHTIFGLATELHTMVGRFQV